MVVNRRSFLAGCLTLGVAPMIVRADSLMRIIPRDTTLILPPADAYFLGDVVVVENGKVRRATYGDVDSREIGVITGFDAETGEPMVEKDFSRTYEVGAP